MKRASLLAFLLLVLGAVAVATLRHPTAETTLLQPTADNPGRFAPSDVATLAATGRPQLVEVFHYG